MSVSFDKNNMVLFRPLHYSGVLPSALRTHSARLRVSKPYMNKFTPVCGKCKLFAPSFVSYFLRKSYRTCSNRYKRQNRSSLHSFATVLSLQSIQLDTKSHPTLKSGLFSCGNTSPILDIWKQAVLRYRSDKRSDPCTFLVKQNCRSDVDRLRSGS